MTKKCILGSRQFSNVPRQIVLKCDVRWANEEERNKPSNAWSQYFNMKNKTDPMSYQTCKGDSGGNVKF